jgi:archaellum component FlaG (FlaF/FlaG flagellin family)
VTTPPSKGLVVELYLIYFGLAQSFVAILFCFAVITLTFVSSNSFESSSSASMCREITVKVKSTMQATQQTFTLDIKKINRVNISNRESEFQSKTYVPIEECGFVLEKTPTSQTLDAIHHKYLRNEPQSVWMPYSYAGDWTRNGFTITNQMKRTSEKKTDTPQVFFEFVNDAELKSVSEEDMNTIFNWLKSNTQKRIAIKSAIKIKIMFYQKLYSTTLNSIKEMNDKNNDNAKQIADLLKQIAILTTEIAALKVQEAELDRQEAAKSALMSANIDDIDSITIKITALKEQIRLEELSLNDLKPTDVTQLTQELNSAILKIHLPTTSPESFLEEYAIGRGNNAQITKEAYASCVPRMEKFEACKLIMRSTGNLKKKLRRSFF